MRGHNHEYKRHGTTTLFAALEVHTGTVVVGHYRRRRRREFLDFMNRVVAQHPETELHVILDNLSTHKPKHDRWLARHPLVYFHYTPTHASWLKPSGGVVQHPDPSRPARPVPPRTPTRYAKPLADSPMRVMSIRYPFSGPKPWYILVASKNVTLI